MINSLINRWKGHREKQFLATHGCKTWREYERRYDKDVGYLANTADAYYHGYPYLFPLDPQGIKDYGFIVRAYHDALHDMIDWCDQNCQGKWRNDWHRGDWDKSGTYHFNSISGGDIVFFAFTDEKDYTWFKLRWA